MMQESRGRTAEFDFEREQALVAYRLRGGEDRREAPFEICGNAVVPGAPDVKTDLVPRAALGVALPAMAEALEGGPSIAFLREGRIVDPDEFHPRPERRAEAGRNDEAYQVLPDEDLGPSPLFARDLPDPVCQSQAVRVGGRQLPDARLDPGQHRERKEQRKRPARPPSGPGASDAHHEPGKEEGTSVTA